MSDFKNSLGDQRIIDLGGGGERESAGQNGGVTAVWSLGATLQFRENASSYNFYCPRVGGALTGTVNEGSLQELLLAFKLKTVPGSAPLPFYSSGSS